MEKDKNKDKDNKTPTAAEKKDVSLPGGNVQAQLPKEEEKKEKV